MDITRKPNTNRKSVTTWWENALSVPFLSQQSMAESLSCPAADFATPLLRECPFDLASIDWKRSHRLAGGFDGHTWKIWLHGHDCPYAIKMFWDAEPPPGSRRYHAPQRECQNNAILQLMQAAVEKAGSPPILINPNPKTKKDALQNTFMFSQEGREAGLSNTDFEPMVISWIPRMRECYGWVKINRSTVNTWPRNARPESMNMERIIRTVSPDKDHVAVLYEYIDETENGNDSAVNGVLVDYSDIVHVGGYGWHHKFYGPRKADKILKFVDYE
ncbi:hypothetical protein GGR53DRAFT_522653 [Hypoxylon sp. FL1150]|nr:hypothetical protein GGR53DRAFT_522653 [Hypoxylon sp. FL1150]